MLPPGGADEIFFDGVRYVSARDAAREFDFDRDYIARLSRAGKIRGRQVGRKWYADHASLREFLVRQNYNKARRFAALAEERRQERARHTGVKVAFDSTAGTLGHVQNIVRTPRDDAASPHRIAIARLSTTRGMHTFVDALRATSQRGSILHPADIFSNAHLPAHAITPAMEFLHKFVALTLAFMLTFGTYAAADPSTARFAAESLDTTAHHVLDSYRSFTRGGLTVLADHAQAQLAAAAEDPKETLASIGSAFGSGVTSLARAFNTNLNLLVYSIAFPDALIQGRASVDASVVPRPRPVAVATSTTSRPPLARGGPLSQTIINNPVIERVIETQRVVAEGGLTEDILNRKLNELDNKLSTKIYALTSVSSPPSSGGFQNQIALTQRIDELRGTSISNSTITGSTFDGSNVTTETLSVTKGATVAGDLTVSGTIVPATASSTNLIFTNATGTNATSTNLFAAVASFTTAIADTLTATIETIASLTATNLVAIKATTTNATSTNLYVSSSLSAVNASTSNLTWINATGTSATTTNLFATTASSTNLFSTVFQTGNATTTGKLYAGTFGIGTSSPSTTFGLVGSEYLTGGLGIGVATTAAGVLQTSGNAWIGGNLQVVGNSVTIGASSANTLSVNSSITSDLVPDQNVTRNLGSPSFYWNNAYIGTLNANNIAAASSTISGTSNASFTINSGNGTADTQDSNLIFFRGTVVPNGLLTWNSAAGKKRFEFNQPLYINNASASTTNPTLTLQGVAGQTANILQVASSSGATLFSIAADGSLSIPNLMLTGSTTLQNFTFVNATGTSATTTSFFATTASSTNLFSQSASVGTLSAGNTTLANATATTIAATTATSSNLTASNSFTFSNVSGFLKAVVGAVSTALINLASDVSGILPVANGGTGWAAIAAGAVPYGNGAGALATTSAGINGQVLALLAGVPTWTATTTFSLGLAYSSGNVTNTGVLSLTQNGGGSAQTGALTFATSSQTTNGQTTGLNITNSGGAFTFAPTLSGTLTAGGGGTGISNPSAAGVLVAAYGGGSWQQIATSSLGLLTTNVAEGTSLYYTDARVNAYVHASTTIPKTYTDNTFTGANTFNGTLTVGSLNGPLDARNGVVGATTSIIAIYGGTGQTLVATGDLLYGSATNAWSRLGASTNGFVLSLANGVPSWVATTTLSTITGTLGVGKGGTGLSSVADGSLLFGGAGGGTANLTVLATTSGAGRFLSLDYSTGRPSWVATTSLGVALADTTGTLAANRGGTGKSSYTPGDILYANSASTLLAVASSTDGFVLSLAYGAPSWVATTTLSTITGTLAATKGGTGQSTVTSGDILYGGTNSWSKLGATTNGFVLALSGGVPAWVATTTLSNISGTLGVGSGGTGITSVADGALLFGGTSGGTANLTALATTSGAGRFLSLDYSSGRPSWVATSSLNVAFANLVGNATVAQGGTGITSYTPGDILYADTATSFARVASSTNGFTLSLANGKPTWTATTTLATISGTLAETKGGTNQTTYTTGDILYASNTNTFSKLGATTNGFTLALSGGVPAWVATTTFSSGLSYAAGNVTLNTASANTWTGLQQFNGQASSTLFSCYGPCYFGGTATTTIDTKGNVGVASSTPWANLAVNPLAGAASNQFVVGSSTATNFLITNAGKVGVGTTSPFSTFSINTSAGVSPFSIGSSTGSYLFMDTSGNVGIGTTSPSKLLSITGGTGTYFDGSGNVGIGTASPGAKLELETATDLLPSGSGATVNMLRMQGGQSGSIWGQRWDANVVGVSVNNSRLTFAAGNNSSGSYTTSDIMTLITSGNVGIGTTTPTQPLVVSKGSAGATTPFSNSIAAFTNSTNGYLSILTPNANESGIFFGNVTSNIDGGILYNSDVSRGLSFRTAAGTRMVLDSSGNVGIGSTDTSKGLLTLKTDGLGNPQIELFAGSQHWRVFNDTGSFVIDNGSTPGSYGTGVFLANGGQSWSGLSDRRYKTNIQALSEADGLDAITRLNPVTFKLMTPGASTSTQIGFIAQEVQQVFPLLVSNSGMVSSTTPDGALGLNYTGFIPPLVKAVQELNLKVESIASSTPSAENQTFVDAFFHNLFARVTQWLADAENGITDFFAGNVHAKNELCVGETCVTPDQFKAMVAASQASGAASSPPQATPQSSPPPDNSSNQQADTIAPTITINGENPAYIHVGDAYSDLGASVSDNVDHNLGLRTFLNGALVSDIVIDTSAAATETIDYVATDQAGNTATSTRQVIIEPVETLILPTNSTSTDATTTQPTTQ